MKLAFTAFKAPSADAREFRLLGYGRQETVDGQAFDFGPDDAAAAVAMHDARGRKLLFDYEHQSISHLPGFEAFKAPNGQAPAAGWTPKLTAREDGLWVEGVEWTKSAAEMIRAGEYLYHSPVLIWKDGQPFSRVVGIHSVALTNDPRLTNISALAARCDLGELLNPSHRKESEMTPLHTLLVGALALSATANDQDILNAVNGIKSTAESNASQITAFKTASETATSKVAALEAELAQLKQTATSAATEITAFKTQVATLTKSLGDTVLAYAEETGRIPPAAKAGFQPLVDKDPVAALTAFKAMAPGGAVPTGRITDTKPVASAGESNGTGRADDHLTACKATAGFDANRLKLHEDAVAYQKKNPNTTYVDAVGIVSQASK